jgi:hypothetical protein
MMLFLLLTASTSLPFDPIGVGDGGVVKGLQIIIIL